jgi:hypothetical protein
VNDRPEGEPIREGVPPPAPTPAEAAREIVEKLERRWGAIAVPPMRADVVKELTAALETLLARATQAEREWRIQPQLSCLLCGHARPRAIWHEPTGVFVCEDCRSAVYRRIAERDECALVLDQMEADARQIAQEHEERSGNGPSESATFFWTRAKAFQAAAAALRRGPEGAA